MRHGGKAPPWAVAIQLGERFGLWPGDVMHKPGSAKWAARVKVYSDELADAQKKA